MAGVQKVRRRETGFGAFFEPGWAIPVSYSGAAMPTAPGTYEQIAAGQAPPPPAEPAPPTFDPFAFDPLAGAPPVTYEAPQIPTWAILAGAGLVIFLLARSGRGRRKAES